MSQRKNLLKRLDEDYIICAEGYLFELERRGYLQAGAFVPEVVLEHPEVVKQLHREFLRAGSNVLEAFTYYAHREKLRLIKKEDIIEPLNRKAIQIAKEVAAEGTDIMVAGNICNTNIYDPDDEESKKTVRAMFEEQVKWAVDEGVDFIIAESFSFYGEALIALEVVKKYGCQNVVSLAVHKDGSETRDGVDPVEACKKLKEAGADVVGLNCMRGPQGTLEIMEKVRKVVPGHLAALPVPYRTTKECPTMFAMKDPQRPNDRPFPVNLDPFTCTRTEIAEFTGKAKEIGIRYLGLCCGAGPHHVRAMAEALGRKPEASKYSADLSKHYALGSDPSLKPINVKKEFDQFDATKK